MDETNRKKKNQIETIIQSIDASICSFIALDFDNNQLSSIFDQQKNEQNRIVSVWNISVSENQIQARRKKIKKQKKFAHTHTRAVRAAWSTMPVRQ